MNNKIFNTISMVFGHAAGGQAKIFFPVFSIDKTEAKEKIQHYIKKGFQPRPILILKTIILKGEE